MKRFFISLAILIVLLLGSVFLFYCSEFYIPLKKHNSVSIPFKTEEKQVLVKENGQYKTIEIKGVDLSASMPAHYASDKAPTKEDYMRWLTQIADMGSNTIRVFTIMDDDFYNAFYQYNQTHQKPLYLLQGIQVEDAINYGSKSAYSHKFMGSLIDSGKKAIDIIHGRKIDIVDGEKYFKNISPWVIGYLVGHEWSADTIAYTDHNVSHDGNYEGAYFSTTKNASAFEGMLAQVMDEMMKYENDKYNMQHIIGFVNAPNTDFLEYKDMYARQLNKYAYLDGEHIKPTKLLDSGYYVGYRMFDFCDNFTNYLSVRQKQELAPMIDKIDSSHAYSGYLDLLSQYHSVPVIMTGYGFSTSRGALKQDVEPLTEKEQGEKLLEVWKDAREADWAGVTISTWQDQWERRTWNTAFSTNLSNNYLWHDLQSDGQNYGIMAYLPEKEACVNIDGVFDEWKKSDQILNTEKYALSLRADHEALYLLVNGKNVSENTKLYIPIDINENVGSKFYSDKLKFNRNVDHLLCIDGKQSTRLLIHERYNAMRANFYYEQTGKDPYTNIPEKHDDDFSVAAMAVRNSVLIDTTDIMNLAERKKEALMKKWDTGNLRYGNGNRNNKSYDSLADFHFGNEGVEVRIPWQLLNISDPVYKQAHKDYYENYGVKTKKIKNFYIGVQDDTQEIKMQKVKFPNLSKHVEFREHLKQSYEMIKSNWTK